MGFCTSVHKSSQTRHTYHVGVSCSSHKPGPRAHEGHVGRIKYCERNCHHGKQRKHWQRAHALRRLVSVELGKRRHQAHSKCHDHCLRIYSTALQKSYTRWYHFSHTMTTKPQAHLAAIQADEDMHAVVSECCYCARVRLLYNSTAVLQGTWSMRSSRTVLQCCRRAHVVFRLKRTCRFEREDPSTKKATQLSSERMHW